MRGGRGPLAESLEHRCGGADLVLWAAGSHGRCEDGGDATKHALFLIGNFQGSRGGEGHFPLLQRA